MNDQERNEILIASRLLAAAWPLSLLLATGCAMAAALLHAGVAAWSAAISLLPGVTGIYLSMRVAFDAGLLREAARQRWAVADLDAGLASLGLRAPAPGPRLWPARCRGALRLILFQGAALVLQIACLAAGALPGLHR